MENLNSTEMEIPKEENLLGNLETTETPMETTEQTQKMFYAGELKTGDFVENASRIKYKVTVIDGFVHLDELDTKGEKVTNAKKRRMPLQLMEGLMRTKHFSQVRFGQRIHHGEVESNLELNKLLPK